MKHQRHFGSATPARDACTNSYWNRQAEYLRLQYRIDAKLSVGTLPAGYDRCMELVRAGLCPPCGGTSLASSLKSPRESRFATRSGHLLPPHENSVNE